MTEALGITTRFDGVSAASLARSLVLPDVLLFAETGSTLDVAHAAGASGAPAGTLVLADRQTAGRGRGGKVWTSPAGSGLWLTLLERPADGEALGVLALRLGLRAAAALDQFATAPVTLKWPNDLQLEGRKLAGVLAEARWRDGRPEWVAIGMGLNVVRPSEVEMAAGLRAGVARLDVLRALVPALRAAASERGMLRAEELAEYARRDATVGRRAIEPAVGVVEGIAASGDLLVRADDGKLAHCRAGSLRFEESA